MSKVIVFLMPFVLAAAGCAGRTDTAAEVPQPAEEKEEIVEYEEKLESGTYAIIDITHGGEELGRVTLKLYGDKTPETVNNFTSLAEGEKEFTDPSTGETDTRPFYDGLIFHRVIRDFMIQGGDPLGTGTGGPGYTFDCEIVPGLEFDRPGLLAMANAGPNTNGSQFFITVAETPWLTGRHTIFGEVLEGMDIIEDISRVRTGPGDRPVDDVVMEKVKIRRVE